MNHRPLSCSAPQGNGSAIDVAPATLEPSWWQRGLRRVDDFIISAAMGAAGNRPKLIVVMIHGLFNSLDEAFNQSVDPYQPFMVSDLCRLIEYFQATGYRFIRPDELHDDLSHSRHRVLLTFDDGYANNLRALPILQRYGVPATVFVAAGNIRSGEAFWWDVLHRERAASRTPRGRVIAERQGMKAFDNATIKEKLRELFGADAMRPVGETDRPMTVAELKSFAADPLVTIGNHTVDHELLTQIPLMDARYQIEECQSMLLDWIGRAPDIIAYPNGNCDDTIVAEAERAGLSSGVMALRGKVRLPLPAAHRMRIPRYAMFGGDNLARQVRTAQAPFSLSGVKHAIDTRRLNAELP